MTFVHERRSTREEFPEWEYLTEICVRNMFGRPLEKWTRSLVVDRERKH